MIAASLEASWPCGVLKLKLSVVPKAAVMSACTPARIAGACGTCHPLGPNIGGGTAVPDAISRASLRVRHVEDGRRHLLDELQRREYRPPREELARPGGERLAHQGGRRRPRPLHRGARHAHLGEQRVARDRERRGRDDGEVVLVGPGRRRELVRRPGPAAPPELERGRLHRFPVLDHVEDLGPREREGRLREAPHVVRERLRRRLRERVDGEQEREREDDGCCSFHPDVRISPPSELRGSPDSETRISGAAGLTTLARLVAKLAAETCPVEELTTWTWPDTVRSESDEMKTCAAATPGTVSAASTKAALRSAIVGGDCPRIAA